MSIESTIDHLLSTLRTISRNMAGEATTLAAQAGTDLAVAKPPAFDKLEFEVKRPNASYVRVPKPPTVPQFSGLTLPTLQGLQSIDQYDPHFSAKPPEWHGPTFQYAPLADAPAFGTPPPAMGSRAIFPVAPVALSVDVPEVSDVRPVTADPLTGAPPSVIAPSVGPFAGDVFEEYAALMALASPSMRAVSQWIETVYETQWSPTERALTGALLLGLEGKGALTEAWERAKAEQGVYDARSARREALEALDASPSSRTGLPMGARRAALLRLERQSTQATMQAWAAAANARQESVAKHRQWAAGLVEQMSGAAIQLRTREAEWTIRGFALALEGAEAVVALLAEVIALQAKSLDFCSRANAAEIKRLEMRVQIELSQLEPLRLAMQSNDLIVARNQRATKIAQIGAQLIEDRVTLLEARIEAMKTDLGWRMLALKAFEGQVEAYTLDVRAKRAEYAVLEATIKGDLAQADAEMAKIRNYTAQLKAIAATADAQAAKIEAQAAENKTAIDAYNTALDAQLTVLKSQDQTVRLALSALAKGFAAETAEQKIKLHRQTLADRDALYEAAQNLSYEETALLDKLHAQSAKVARAKAKGDIIIKGAGVVSGIAKQAFAGLTAVGVTETIAEA